MTANPYSISVELPNGAKFRAKGDVDDVRLDAREFYDRLIAVSAPVAAHPSFINGNRTNGTRAALSEPPVNGNSTTVEPIEQPTPVVDGGLDRATLDRLFAKDRNGTVSLKALPRGENAEANALVALIYGAAKLADEDQVTGSRLMKAAQQSGLQVDRVDRSLSTQIGQHVTTAGFKKGRRYGLTNPGIRRAEEILTGILG